MSKIKLSETFIKDRVKLALTEDLYPHGDITSNLLNNNKIIEALITMNKLALVKDRSIPAILISGPILICFSFFVEDPIRDFQIIHIWGLLFQSIVVVAGGFLFWLWLLSKYPASGVASFSFLTPIFTIFFGWLILSEVMTPDFIFAAFLVITGLILINK